MALKFDKKLFFYFTIPLLTDRLTKYFVLYDWWPSQTINAVFNICLIHNQGIAWGLGSQLHADQSYWLNLLIAAILIYFAWYIKTIADDAKMLFACSLIFSGGVSNFFDRLWYGTVIDFIQLHIADWYFPVFNVADISITIGAMLLTYFVLFDDKK